MTWRDELRPASFRGVAFQVREVPAEGGRRFVADETPETDAISPTNDLGKRRVSYHVRGFVVGPDYLDQRDRLLAAINDTFGPGDLVLPWRFRKRVQCGPATWTYGPAHNACTIEWDCVDAGGDPLQVVTPLPAARMEDQVALVSEGGLALAVAANERGEDLLDGFEEFAMVPELVQLGRYTRVDFLEAGLGLPEYLATIDEARGLLAYLESVAAAVWPSTGSTRDAGIAQATDEVREGIRVTCLARLAELTTEATYPSAEQAEDALAALAAAFEAWLAALDDTDLYTAVLDLRTIAIDELTAAAARLPRERTITVPIPKPAIVIAFELYGTRRLEEREAQIVARNSVGHPGFAHGDLVVLSR